jgi:DNA-directed RNA polymerase III subunit RPC3
LRSERLTAFARKYLGDIPAAVYQALLRKLDEKVPRIRDDYVDYLSIEEELHVAHSVTSREVMEMLDTDVNISEGFQTSHSNGVNGDTGSGSDEEEEEDEDEDDSEDGQYADTNRLKYIRAHLQTLEHDPRKFVERIGMRGGGEWTIDFRTLSSLLLQDEIESIVSVKFGSIATKIVRMLKSKGKLDEKQLGNFALQKPKTIKETLNLLQETSYIELQEVPRDLSRVPPRTIFLWTYDQDHCRRKIISECYQALARVFQRINVEKAHFQSVIDKAERTDVVGREDRYLSAVEKNALKDWSDIEEKLLVQASRLDDSMAVLRDYHIPPLPKSSEIKKSDDSE